MAKIVGMKTQEDFSEDFIKVCREVKDAKDSLAELIQKYEASITEEKTDILTEALDALEDACEILEELDIEK